MFKKVKDENDILAETATYLSFLHERFSSALQQINNRITNLEIVENLSLNNIYTNDELNSPDFILDLNRFDLFLENRQRDLKYPFKTFLEVTRVVCLERTDIEVEFDEELGFGFGEYDMTSKFLTQFSRLYLEKVESLIRNFTSSNLKQQWTNIIGEKNAPFEILKTLERIENDFSNQRGICTFYYELTSIVNDNNKVREIDLDVEENWHAYSHLFEGEERPKKGWVLGESGPLREEIAILEKRGAQYFLKFTLLEDRDTFLNAIKAILKQDLTFGDSEREKIHRMLAMFIDNNFHFHNSIYTTKIRQHDKPPFKANDLAVLLRIYLDNSKLIGATKKDVIAWLAHEFYGTRGFTMHNLKGYLERKALTKRHKQSGHTIIKGFEKKFPKI